MTFTSVREPGRMVRDDTTALPERLLGRLLPLCLLVTGSAYGVPSDPLSLTEGLQLAELRSARRAAADQAITSASERAISGAHRPDPVLRAGIDNLPLGGADRFTLGRDLMTMRRFGVAQELTGTGKQRLRRERGEQVVALERTVRRAAVSALRREVAAAWLDRAYASTVSRWLESLSAEVRFQVQTLEASTRSVAAAATELRVAQTMLAQVEDQLSASQQQERVAARMRERWLGDDAMRAPTELPDTEALDAAAPEALTTLAHHAEIAVARETEALSASDVRLARGSLTPDWTL